MQVICKLKRKGGTVIDIAGRHIHFAPNDADDHVAEIDDDAVLHRLVNEIPEAYALYGKDAGKKVARPKKPLQFGSVLDKPARAPNEPDTLVITNGEGEQIDLMALDRAALAQLATDEFGIEVHPRWRPENIRAKIIEALRAMAD